MSPRTPASLWPDGQLRPAGSTSGRVPSEAVSSSGERSGSIQAPSRVIAIGTASKRSGSSASMTERADTTDTWCSAERPPYRMARRVLSLATPPPGLG